MVYKSVSPELRYNKAGVDSSIVKISWPSEKVPVSTILLYFVVKSFSDIVGVNP